MPCTKADLQQRENSECFISCLARKLSDDRLKCICDLSDSTVYSIFIWELFPEWMFPLLTGFSIFCLANPNSPAFSRVFGGTNGNEGLGLLSICFDWQVCDICNFLSCN